MQITDIVAIVLGLVGLFLGGNWLVRGAGRLATSFGVSPMLVGMTVVAFGTSAPELLVSASAALSGVSDLALGNVVGSNIANVGLMLGLAALMVPFRVEWTLIKREIPVMLIATASVIIFAYDGLISQAEGGVLLMGLALFLLLQYRWMLMDRAMITPEVTDYDRALGVVGKDIHRLTELGFITIGLIALVIGSQLMISGAVSIARHLGISELIVGVTLVAVGTSLPELVTTIVAARRKQSDIAVGNAVGSNIFNLLLILSITTLIRPIPADLDQVGVDFLFMILTAAIIPLLLMPTKGMGRGRGFLLLALYGLYVILAIVRGRV